MLSASHPPALLSSIRSEYLCPDTTIRGEVERFLAMPRSDVYDSIGLHMEDLVLDRVHEILLAAIMVLNCATRLDMSSPVSERHLQSVTY